MQHAGTRHSQPIAGQTGGPSQLPATLRVRADAPRDTRSARRAAGQRPGVQGALARSMGARETERPRLDDIRAAGAGVRPVVRDDGQGEGTASGISRCLRWSPSALRCLQHVCTCSRRHSARTRALWRGRTSFAPGPDGLDRHPICGWLQPSGYGAGRLWRRRAYVHALRIWRRSPPLLTSVATSYDIEWGVSNVGRIASGTIGANTFEGFYESMDAGLTWAKTGEDFVPLETRQLMELGVKEPSGIFSGGNIRITNYEVLSSGKEVYSFEYLQSGGNRWMQALDKRDVKDRAIATRPLDIFYDGRSGNLILAMGLQGVVVVAPDGTTTRVAVGPHSPTDFSFWSKTRTFFGSLASGETAVYTGLAVLLAFSFAALALAGFGGVKVCEDLLGSSWGNLSISSNLSGGIPLRTRAPVGGRIRLELRRICCPPGFRTRTAPPPDGGRRTGDCPNKPQANADRRRGQHWDAAADWCRRPGCCSRRDP